MADTAMSKIAAKTARELCDLFPLSEAGRALLAEGQAPAALLLLLVEKGLFPDAVQMLANALPKREAVGWAWACASKAGGDKPEPKIAAALQAARKWVVDPNEENRRLAQKASDAAGLNTAAGCVAGAAFWSGGSLAAPNQPVVPPDEKLTAKGAGGAVLLSGVIGEPAQAMARYRRYVELGIEVARGATPWN
jgi:hypothetical protein